MSNTSTRTLPAALNPKEPLAFCEWVSLFTLYIWAFSSFFPALHTVVLWGLIPVCFVLCFYRYPRMILNPYIVLLAILYCWLTFLVPIADHPEAAYSSTTRIWGTFGACFITACLAQKRRAFILACGSWVLLLVMMIWYAQTHILETLDIAKNRLQDEKMNANAFAYILLIVVFVVYLFGDIKNFKFRRWWQIGLILLIPISWYISVLAASRQVMILILPYIAITLFKRYFTPSVKNIFITIAIVSFSIIAYLNWGQRLYERSFLRQRMEIKVKDDSRALLVKESIETFENNPFTGIGPDQFRFVSTEGAGAHNSFLELLADSGILGGVIYLYFVLRMLFSNYKRWKRTKSDFYFIVFTYGLAYTFQNFFYIFYNSTQLIAFFILVAIYSDQVWNALKYRNRPEVAEEITVLNILPSTNHAPQHNDRE